MFKILVANLVSEAVSHDTDKLCIERFKVGLHLTRRAKELALSKQFGGIKSAFSHLDQTRFARARPRRACALHQANREKAREKSQWDIAVFLPRVFDALAPQHCERTDDAGPRLTRQNDVVDIAALCRDKRR